MKNYVHINQHKIKHNHKTGAREPVISIKNKRANTYAHEAKILGPSKIVYSPDKPLRCGARVWIETESEVVPLPDRDALVGGDDDGEP